MASEAGSASAARRSVRSLPEVDEASSVIQSRRLGRTYADDGLAVQALSDVDLDIARGGFTMVVGPSGSGKSTLLHLFGGIDRPSAGTLHVCGQDLAKLTDDALTDFRARRIGFIFQAFNLHPMLTAYENVEMALLLLGAGRVERKRRTLEILDAVGLADHARHRPNQLSGGQKQRVAIARALVKDPELVLADEPTANLDTGTGAAVIELMRRVQRERRATFVFSTHDPQLISHADSTIRLRDGRVVEHGRPQR